MSNKNYTIVAESSGTRTELTQASTLDEAVDAVISLYGTYGDSCVLIIDTKTNQAVPPTQKMLKKILTAIKRK